MAQLRISCAPFPHLTMTWWAPRRVWHIVGLQSMASSLSVFGPAPPTPKTPGWPFQTQDLYIYFWGEKKGKNPSLLHLFPKTALLVAKFLHLKKNLIVRLRPAINVWLFLSVWGHTPATPGKEEAVCLPSTSRVAPVMWYEGEGHEPSACREHRDLPRMFRNIHPSGRQIAYSPAVPQSSSSVSRCFLFHFSSSSFFFFFPLSNHICFFTIESTHTDLTRSSNTLF